MSEIPVTGSTSDESPKLVRQMGFVLLTLYGLSVTVGAGIYVLVGEVAQLTGGLTPLAFVGASLLISFSAASYAELSARFPVSAGEAAYIEAGLKSPALAVVAGLLVAFAGIVSSAALLRGGAGYVTEFIAADEVVVALMLGLLIGAIAMWGIKQAAWTAAILGLFEVGLLVVIVAFGLMSPEQVASGFEKMVHAPQAGALAGFSSAVLIAFFAYIGFEDLVNVAEEVKEPTRTMPRAIAATLVITAILYFLVALVAISFLSIDDLAQSSAPMTLLFSRLTGGGGEIVTLVAIFAVLNGVLVQLIMASRVVYGLSRMGHLPKVLGRVNAVTRTPLFATALALFIALVLSTTSGTAVLAQLTAGLTLLVFAFVNLALLRMKLAKIGGADGIEVPIWVPAVGFAVSLCFVAYEVSRKVMAVW